MNKILFKHLESGKNLYNLKKATEGSSGFDLLAALEDKVVLNTWRNKTYSLRFLIANAFRNRGPSQTEIWNCP